MGSSLREYKPLNQRTTENRKYTILKNIILYLKEVIQKLNILKVLIDILNS